MKKIWRLAAAALLATGTCALPGLAADVTVGRFYTEVAKARHLEAADAASAEAALRGAGVELPKLALNAPLTEGALSSISTALGVKVTTQRPSQLVDEAQMNTYVSTFSREIGTSVGVAPQPYGTGTGGTDPGNSGNGKGKKKGHNKSTSEPI